jgi:hypothetical protein
MFGGLRLLQVEGLGNFLDRLLILSQEIDDVAPLGFGDGVEDV